MEDQSKPHSGHIMFNGLVSHKDKQPYVQMDFDGRMITLTIAQARSIASDMIITAARAEVDAMVWKFFDANEFPPQAAGRMMVDFRDFRSELDKGEVERMDVEPDDSGNQESD